MTAEDSGTASVTVTAQDSDGNSVSDAFEVTVNAQQQKKANSAPTVASAIDDATIVNTSGTHEVTLSSIFSDEDAARHADDQGEILQDQRRHGVGRQRRLDIDRDG